MNTCNGYTYFRDGSKVDSVANRMVTFTTKTPHAGEGIPSKKLSFQEGSASELTLNLASLNATQIT